MSTKYLDSNGLLYFWQKIKNIFATKDVATTSANGLMSYTDKGKLDGIATGAEVNVQSDWNQTTTTADDYIKNKPTIPSDASQISYTDPDSQTTTVEGELDGILDTLEDLIISGGEPNTIDTISVNGTNVPPDAQKNVAITTPNAFANVTVGSNTLSADSIDDTLTINSDGDSVVVGFPNVDTVKICTNSYAFSEGSTNGKFTVSKTSYDSSGTASTVSSSIKVHGLADLAYKSSLVASDIPDLSSTYCPLDGNGKVDASHLPSYVDDVIEAYPVSGATALSAGWLSETSGGSALTPETGKIYVLMETSGDYAANTQFRWGGTAYVKLADGGVSSITNAEIDIIVAS